MLMSFIATCKRCRVEPFAWRRDVLSRVASHPVNRLAELLPNSWKPLDQGNPGLIPGHGRCRRLPRWRFTGFIHDYFNFLSGRSPRRAGLLPESDLRLKPYDSTTLV
jgi:hypothetical protein